MNREELSTICKRCGQLAEGYAFIGEDRYCHPDGGVDCYTLASHDLTSLANQAFIEKAQDPTDDEREALSNFLFSVYEHGSQPNALREADAILSFLASRRPAQTEPTDAQIEVIADSIESFFEEHVHMARRLYPDVWKRDLALVVLKAAFAAGQEDKP